MHFWLSKVSYIAMDGKTHETQKHTAKTSDYLLLQNICLHESKR